MQGSTDESCVVCLNTNYLEAISRRNAAEVGNEGGCMDALWMSWQWKLRMRDLSVRGSEQHGRIHCSHWQPPRRCASSPWGMEESAIRCGPIERKWLHICNTPTFPWPRWQMPRPGHKMWQGIHEDWDKAGHSTKGSNLLSYVSSDGRCYWRGYTRETTAHQRWTTKCIHRSFAPSVLTVAVAEHTGIFQLKIWLY